MPRLSYLRNCEERVRAIFPRTPSLYGHFGRLHSRTLLAEKRGGPGELGKEKGGDRLTTTVATCLKKCVVTFALVSLPIHGVRLPGT